MSPFPTQETRTVYINNESNRVNGFRVITEPVRRPKVVTPPPTRGHSTVSR